MSDRKIDTVVRWRNGRIRTPGPWQVRPNRTDYNDGLFRVTSTDGQVLDVCLTLREAEDMAEAENCATVRFRFTEALDLLQAYRGHSYTNINTFNEQVDLFLARCRREREESQ